MARYVLRIAGGSTDGRELELAGPVEIGRDPAAGLALPDDQLVSSRHASVSPHADGAVVEDLGSRNGTFVNNVRIADADADTAGRRPPDRQYDNRGRGGPGGGTGRVPPSAQRAARLARPAPLDPAARDRAQPVGRPRADRGSPGLVGARPARAARGRRGRGGSRLTERHLRERHAYLGTGVAKAGDRIVVGDTTIDVREGQARSSTSSRSSRTAEAARKPA